MVVVKFTPDGTILCNGIAVDSASKIYFEPNGKIHCNDLYRGYSTIKFTPAYGICCEDWDYLYKITLNKFQVDAAATTLTFTN